MIIPSSIKNSFELSYEPDDFLDGFSWSMGITIDEERIYVADGTKNQILIFDIINNIFLEKISLQEVKCGGHIHGMEVQYEKIFVVKENQDCIAIFDLTGKFLYEFGEKGFNEGEFEGPQNLDIYQEKIFVTDSGNNRIQIFDLEGNFLDEIGVFGKGPGEFDWVTGVKIYQEKIFVTDSGNNRIQIFDLEGNFLDEILSEFKTPHQILINENYIYVLDTYNYKVKIFSDIINNENWIENYDFIIYFGILLIIIIIISILIFLRKR